MKIRTFIFWVILLGIILGIAFIGYKSISPFFPSSNEEVTHWKKQARTLEERLSQKENELSQKEDELKQERDKVADLEKKLSDSEKNDENQLSSSNSSKSAEEMLDLLYPMDMEKEYKPLYQTTKFYSHPSCKEKYLIKSDLTFVGAEDHHYTYYDKKSNMEYIFYSSRIKSKKGKYVFVYSKQIPVFTPYLNNDN